ncbi:Ig domain-containing protein [Streptomyces iconiensis]|uniref:Ig domain-containing protein n=1 Tax=Streptomyces iconiensis TaxID=1384038 RepID=A0ABT6ZQR8_9ACTN|nr:Ig domain-containing protein [Streptomyces iconiensis]MDJ1131393.1 Ig domain-containing protein [Streptomyces iconiensis]
MGQEQRALRRSRAWRTAAGVGALALALGVTATVPAGAAGGGGAPAGARSENRSLRLAAGYLAIDLDSAGTVVGLQDSRTGTGHLATGKSASLVSLVIDGRQVRPTRVERHGALLTFSNRRAGFAIDVKAVDHGAYTTLEAVRVEGPAGGDVQTLLWGPLATDITRTVGESVGVVRDDGFAIGLRPLTDRTEGAWPQEYQDYGWEREVADNPSRLQVAPHEEWSAAGRTPWGSVLRAFTYDYTKKRSRSNLNGYRIPVGPLHGPEGRITGSKVALFGASPELTPTVLSGIARGEHLPYPTQNGQWQKTAQASSRSFLVLSDLRTGNIPDAARLAKAAGIGYLYSLPNSYGPWKSTGHYEFDASLGGDDAGAAHAVALARANGVRLGVHTLSDFIATDDPYVVPAPADDRLALGGSARLTRPLARGDTTLYLDSGGLLADGVHNRVLRVGDEFLAYASARKTGDVWQVTGLRRAQWGSAAAPHAAGDRTARVIANGYGGAVGGNGIIDDIAGRLSTVWNRTGIMANSFDGVESASESGWGSYGQARLVNGTYARTRTKDGFITETSRMSSNTWDALTRASWGEVGVTSMDQVFLNNAFYKDNFLPGMLGWISLKAADSLLDVEGKMARGAGLNAGSGFQASVRDLAAGGDKSLGVLDAVKQWDAARNVGAFTEAQKARFRDPSTNWHLTAVTPGKEWSLQELDARGEPVGAAQRVRTPTPELSTAPLPPAHAHDLYETRVTTNTPATVRYEVISGALPEGLRLNKDTGGITGKPQRPTAARFTVLARHTDGLPDARANYTITVRR